MTVNDRDRRALVLLGLAVVLVFVFYLLTGDSGRTAATGSSSVRDAELRLRKLRTIAAALPQRRRTAQALHDALVEREKTLVAAQDSQLAQEHLLDVIQKIAQSQNPPLEIRSKDLAQPKPIGDYGELPVTLTLTCRIEQLVNLMADLSAQAEAIGTDELHINSVRADTKEMQVRLTLGGLMSKRLLPRKELARF